MLLHTSQALRNWRDNESTLLKQYFFQLDNKLKTVTDEHDLIQETSIRDHISKPRKNTLKRNAKLKKN